MKEEEQDISSLVKQLKESYKPVSSFVVFTAFISTENGKVDVSAVFSLDCLRVWLQTRTNKVKFPQQSFQRVLYAHIRGVEQRKPFPKEVEAEFLKILRTSNPWKKLLISLGKEPVRRRFKKLGFHEREESKTLDETSTALTVLAQSSNPVIQPIAETPVDTFFRVLENSLSQQQFKQVLQTANASGYQFDTPAMKYMLSLDHHPEDFRFNPSFFSIDQQSACFLEGLPIGTLVHSTDWTIEYMDETAKEICGGDCTNMHFFRLMPSLASVLLAHPLWIPDILRTGKIWTRNAFFSLKGELVVVIAFNMVLPTPGPCYKTIHKIQNVTHLYPDICNQNQNAPFLLS